MDIISFLLYISQTVTSLVHEQLTCYLLQTSYMDISSVFTSCYVNECHEYNMLRLSVRTLSCCDIFLLLTNETNKK